MRGDGTVGGVFTPTLFTGASFGFVAGHLLHTQHPVVLAIYGTGQLMAAVTCAPFMAGYDGSRADRAVASFADHSAM
ncbi:chloride channel protein [Edaphobacter modestus]|uniref:chloride channel protein n=1 Tax=Edaphobacter modestus TaxID=388466 RepID=UPI00102C7AC8